MNRTIKFSDSKPPLPKPTNIPQPKSLPSPCEGQGQEKRQQKRALPQELLAHKSETVICLKNQNLTKISQRDLEKYKKYMGFDLSFNQIYFSDDLCRHFQFIKLLNISHNQIDKLPHDIHRMENLTIFDVSNNKIAKLPLNLYKMTKLSWMDIRGNPFLETWNESKHKETKRTEVEPDMKSNRSEFYDPQKFVYEIRPFMLAVKDWRDSSIRKNAEEILEYLVICPVQPPCQEDAEYDLTTQDYSECPFYKLMETHPEEIQAILDLTEKNRPTCFSYPEDHIRSAWNQYSRRLLKLTFLQVPMLLLTLLSLAVAFMEPKRFSDLIHYIFPPDHLLGNFFKAFHSTGQSLTPLFPIREPRK